MSSTVGFQPRPFAVKLPRWLEADKNGVRAHSEQEVTRKGLAGRLWVVHWGKVFADSKEGDFLYFVTKGQNNEDRNQNQQLGKLPDGLDTTKKFTATLVVIEETTHIEFQQENAKVGELICEGILNVAEGEEEPAGGYSIGQILAVTAVALVVLLGVAYTIAPK